LSFGADYEALTEEDRSTLMAQVLESRINEVLLIQSAQNDGITVSNELVDQEYSAIVAASGGAETMAEQLTANGISEEEVKENIREQMALQAYINTIAGEVTGVGLGPLHTEFDGKGYAYTSAFITSEVVKWKIGTWEVVDRIDAYYSIGHLMIPGGGSMKPWGKYLVALNKMTKDRYLSTGPELAHAAQLIDISGEKMKLLLDFPTIGEPHYAQGIPANLIHPNTTKIYTLEANEHPHAWRPVGH